MPDRLWIWPIRCQLKLCLDMFRRHQRHAISFTDSALLNVDPVGLHQLCLPLHHNFTAKPIATPSMRHIAHIAHVLDEGLVARPDLGVGLVALAPSW